MNTLEEILAGAPSTFTDKEIDDFVAFVVEGGEVTANGLKRRVLDATYLSFAREAGVLLAVGGLKNPLDVHRHDVREGSGFSLSLDSFPYELGWVFVSPIARNRKLSYKICEPLIAAAGDKGVFATSHESREYMHRTLEKFGFAKHGNNWSSLQNPGNLFLFIRAGI